MVDELGLSAATVNRRLCSLKSMVKLARLTGRITWTIDVPGLRRAKVKDTKGPGEQKIGEMIALLRKGKDTPNKRRNLALVRMAADLGLRRGELVSLDLGNLNGDTVMVLGKGASDREPVTVPRLTREALRRWLEVHPDPEPPTVRAAYCTTRSHHRDSRTALG